MEYPSNLITESAQIPELPCRTYRQANHEIRSVKLMRALARRLGRDAGEYVTVLPMAHAKAQDTIAVLARHLHALLRASDISGGELLIVGLGNHDYIADALGARVIERIVPKFDRTLRLCTIAPRVQGVSGISSYDVIRGTVHAICPCGVIAVDTLTTRDPARLGNCYQMTTAGIRPGSGANNPQPALNRSTLGVPVIAIGVPLLISVGAMCNVAPDTQERLQMVTPHSVDQLVETCSERIAGALMRLSERFPHL